MNLDIHTAILAAFILAIIGLILGLVVGVRNIRAGQKLQFFKKRRDLMVRGWRSILAAIILGVIAFSLRSFAEPTIYQVFPPSPTITLTPTITKTPTISLTPTITFTPTITPTPLFSPTPEIPPFIATEFTALVAPNPNSVFSVPVFTKELDENMQPVEVAAEFENPVGRLYAFFSYDQMLSGSQWTAIWYRLEDLEVICFETKPWDWSTGGYGYSDCSPSSDQWKPGEYEVQIFVGTTWNASARFTVTGVPDTPTVTPTPSRTPTSTWTATSTRTATQTRTVTPTRTQTITLTPSNTRTPTNTQTVTRTPGPTLTSTPTRTQTATRTPFMTDTSWPSPTP